MFLNRLKTIAKSKRQPQSGSALIIAVFIILVMSGLIASLTKTIASSSAQVSTEVLGTRALFAAEAGNEMVLAQLFPTTGGVSSCSANQQMYLTTRGFNQCSVTSSCTQRNVSGTDYFYIVSKGVCKVGLAGTNSNPNNSDVLCLSSDPFCVSRTVEVEAKATE